MRKLRLNPETIRALTSATLTAVRGGIANTQGADCTVGPTCELSCGGTCMPLSCTVKTEMCL